MLTLERKGRSRTDDDYGQGEATIVIDEELLLDEKALSAKILEVFRRPDYAPPQLPAVATQLMRLCDDRDADIKEIVALLQSDPVLAGHCLKMVQSIFYSRGREVDNLQQAVVRLGWNTLHQIVMRVSMNMRVFRCKSYAPAIDRVRKHSTATAVFSDLYSKKTSQPSDDIFTCGLLHDVGLAGILLVLGDVPRGTQPPDLTLLWPAIHRCHAEAGSIMTRLWGLSDELSRVAWLHHQVVVDGSHHPMSAIVALADDLAAQLGMPGADDGLTDTTPPRILESAREFLGIDDRANDKVRAEAEKLVEQGAV